MNEMQEIRGTGDSVIGRSLLTFYWRKEYL